MDTHTDRLTGANQFYDLSLLHAIAVGWIKKQILRAALKCSDAAPRRMWLFFWIHFIYIYLHQKVTQLMFLVF